MPHLTLEYSGNVTDLPDINDVFGEIHRVLQKTAGIKIANCKSRARVADEYLIADGGPAHAFVHLDVRILDGRSVELKKELGNRLL
ncbi:MAG: isomerase, partial [Bacteroidetes bacterium]|nr:isomerase [Bacteroidota bacterium]